MKETETENICENCYYWNNRDELGTFGNEEGIYGICTNLSHYFQYSDGIRFRPVNTFGCNQWEQKKEYEEKPGIKIDVSHLFRNAVNDEFLP